MAVKATGRGPDKKFQAWSRDCQKTWGAYNVLAPHKTARHFSVLNGLYWGMFLDRQKMAVGRRHRGRMKFLLTASPINKATLAVCCEAPVCILVRTHCGSRLRREW